jgi:CRP-like cAMP-binding protein
MENLKFKKDLVEKYLSENDNNAAIELLLELINSLAVSKDFQAAEALRDRIFAIDPMAIHAIVQAAEIIEKEMTVGIDKNHRELWAGLYDTLTSQETTALYFSLQKAEYEPDQTIYKQGERKPRLFFINSGFAKLIYFRDGVERFIKRLGPGQIAAEDGFFFDTVCTTSLITLSKVEVSYLDATILNEWKTSFPLIETKLQNFASKSERVIDLLKCKGLDRRCAQRISITGSAVIKLVSSAGKSAAQPFKVEMSDISQGGISFFARITKKETAGMLLGKKVTIRYLHPQMDLSKAIEQDGTIVAIRLYPFEDSSVHVKFDNTLSQRLIQEFAQMSTLQIDRS